MASHEGSKLISQLIAQHLLVLHLRLRLVLNNCPSENEKEGEADGGRQRSHLHGRQAMFSLVGG